MAGVFLSMQVALSAFGCPLPALLADAGAPAAVTVSDAAPLETSSASTAEAQADCHHTGIEAGTPEHAPCKAFCDSDTQASATREAPTDFQHVALPLIVRNLEPLAPAALAGLQARAVPGAAPSAATPLYLALLVLRN